MEQIGRYQLIRKLAAGGMGEVYLARVVGTKGFQKRVVIKRIHAHLAEIDEFVEMFLNEGKLAALLNHPNIVQIFDLGEDGGTYYITMEHVDGPSLFHLVHAALKRGLLLPVDVVVKIISFALEGLSFAHTFVDDKGKPLNLIHRDISPDNILIARSGGVKLADFGIARAATVPRVTQTGTFKGKVSYLAPEMMRTKDFDQRADLFSMGVTLYESLCGVKPFGGSNTGEILTNVAKGKPKDLLELRADCPPELAEIVMHCLEKRPDDRYPSARALQQDLERYLVSHGSAVTAGDIATFVAELVPPQPEEDLPEEAPNMGTDSTRMSQGTRKEGRAAPATQATGTRADRAKAPGTPPPPVATPPAGGQRRRSSAFAASEAELTDLPTAAVPSRKMNRPASTPPSAAVAPEDLDLSAEEERERSPQALEGEKFNVRMSWLVGGVAVLGVAAFGITRAMPKPKPRVAGSQVVDQSINELAILSDPPGAEIWIDNKVIGKTPYKAENSYPFGMKVDVAVRMMGMADVKTRFVGGRGQKVQVVLAPPSADDE